ncbi:hypothetical protein CTI12_AA108240 [Artemisia annua]|uniref:Uncharacterized protein n=1 Tax=Artemisia annua TaxID=35608 RepID=A0A2U1PN36_ARTAN|nr:hypothetical protein CTI12_AA108240 [Artemisia annua]
MGVNEGARNRIIAHGFQHSQNFRMPSGIAKGWVKTLVHSWSKSTKSALRHNCDVSLEELSGEEMNTLLAVGVTNDKYGPHLTDVANNTKLCRAMIAVFCPPRSSQQVSFFFS